MALAQAINETASAGSLEKESKTPGSRGPRAPRARNASQLGAETGTKSQMGQKKLASKFQEMRVEV